MKKLTVEQMMSFHPCSKYPIEKVTALWAGREALTALDIISLDIPPEDRLWAVLREEFIDAPIQEALML